MPEHDQEPSRKNQEGEGWEQLEQLAAEKSSVHPSVSGLFLKVQIDKIFLKSEDQLVQELRIFVDLWLRVYGEVSINPARRRVGHTWVQGRGRCFMDDLACESE